MTVLQQCFSFAAVLICESVSAQDATFPGVFARSVSFSPDGKWIAAGGRTPFDTKSPDALLISTEDRGLDGIVKVWDAQSRKEIWSLVDTKKMVACMAFAPKGSILAVGYRQKGVAPRENDYPLILWDLKTKKEKLVLPSTGTYDCLKFSADGKWLAASWTAKPSSPSVTLWELPSGKERRKISLGRRIIITALTFSIDHSHLLLGTNNGTMYTFNLQTERVAKFYDVHSEPGSQSVDAISFSPDGKWFAFSLLDFGSGDKTLRLYSWPEKKMHLESRPHSHNCITLAFGGASNVLLTSGIEVDPNDQSKSWGAVKMWQVPSGKLLHTRKTVVRFSAMDVSPDRRKLLLGGGGPTQIWDLPKAFSDTGK